jgi:drug/metabolite transporter (DMT)-like permease
MAIARLKKPYVNDLTGEQEMFTWAAGFLVFPCGVTWLVGELVNKHQIPENERTHIPAKKAAICAITVAISTLTYTYAIYLTNYPVVMMFKSCNILSVILVGVCCSRVTDAKLKLGPKKIAVGLIVTLGIVLFKAFDP